MEQRRVLRLYDTDMVGFSLTERGIDGLQAEIFEVNRDRVELLPLDLELSGEGMVEWLRRRTIPKNRAFVSEILRTLGLSANRTRALLTRAKGFP